MLLCYHNYYGGDEVGKLIEKYAKKYAIPAGLIKAIIEQESGGNTFAMRYEKGYPYLVKPFNKYHFNEATEKVSQQISWGLMQIMGAVARERGFTGRYLSELTNPKVGLKYGCKHLKWNYNRYNNWQDAISAFNQGSNRKTNGKYNNQQYVDSVMQKWGE